MSKLVINSDEISHWFIYFSPDVKLPLAQLVEETCLGVYKP